MNVYCVQPDTTWMDRDANYRRVEDLLSKQPPEAGSFVLLPELFATGFSMDAPEVAEKPDGPTERFCLDLARRHEVCLVAGHAGWEPGNVAHNEAVVYVPDNGGQILARCPKLHPFPLTDEASRYDPGADVVTFAWGRTTLSALVCYDLRFPEAFRRGVRRGVEVFCVLANWPAERAEHWLALLRARAIENQAYVAGVNRTGSDPNLRYDGRSVIVAPDGEVVAEAGQDEGVVSAPLQIDALRAWRSELPALASIREDLLSPARPTASEPR